MLEHFRYRHRIKHRPRPIRSGQFFYAMPRNAVDDRAEEALIVSFVCDRKLFGLAYSDVQPDYFYGVPQDSGVFICPVVKTSELFLHVTRPGDIDLLVLPYEEDELVLERVLAIEVKAVRASFSNQGRSPNEYGFSQAFALLEIGFPYVAVAHLIVSDSSPEEYWKQMAVAKVIDREGNVRLLEDQRVDYMPHALIDRSFGRLKKNCSLQDVGLISAYIHSRLFGTEPYGRMISFPEVRRATLNPNFNRTTLDRVAVFFERNYERFLDTPRYDPVLPSD